MPNTDGNVSIGAGETANSRETLTATICITISTVIYQYGVSLVEKTSCLKEQMDASYVDMFDK